MQLRKALPKKQITIFYDILREGKPSRRELLKILGYSAAGAVIGGNILTSVVCKGGSPNSPDKPHPVTVRAMFYNHTQGPITEKIYSGMSGNPLLIKTSDISAGNVDQARIAVRRATSGSSLGALVGFSRNGEVSTTYPDNNSDFDVFLMNTSAGANYQLIDNWVDKYGGILSFSPDAKWKREDLNGVTGPEEPILTVMDDLNNALDYPWKKYGSYNKVSSGADFGVGYNNTYPYHSATWAGIPYNTSTEYAQLTGFCDEIFELVTQTDDLDGSSSTWSVICDRAGRLNAIGRDLLAYVYVKDSKTP